MTEHVRLRCIRGCTEPLYDQQTREKIGVTPKPATMGLLDTHCAGQLMTWLREIPALYAMLDTRKGSANAPFAPGKRQKISGSPALIRLDVAILQDPRSTSGATYRGETVHEPEDINDHPSDIPGQYIAWANSMCDDLHITTRPTTLTEAIQILTGGWYENLCYRPWIEDLYDDTRDTRQLLRRKTGTTGPRPIGKCGCGETVWEPEPTRETKANPDGAIIECRGCGHRMNSMAIVRLAAAQRVTGDTA